MAFNFPQTRHRQKYFARRPPPGRVPLLDLECRLLPVVDSTFSPAHVGASRAGGRGRGLRGPSCRGKGVGRWMDVVLAQLDEWGVQCVGVSMGVVLANPRKKNSGRTDGRVSAFFFVVFVLSSFHQSRLDHPLSAVLRLLCTRLHKKVQA